MALVHALIGLGEAVITGVVVRFVLLRRPDLLEPDEGTGGAAFAAGRWVQTTVAGLGMALGVAVFLAPFAWDTPDGLEYVGANLGFVSKEAPPVLMASPMADYRLDLPGLNHVKVATALAGLIGTLVVFGVSWGMARVLPRAKNERAQPDAA
jgi:cobalt/nickel transport system permease protein